MIYAVEVFVFITNLIIIFIKIINFILLLEIDLLKLELSDFENVINDLNDDYKSILLIYYENKEFNKKMIREIKIF